MLSENHLRRLEKAFPNNYLENTIVIEILLDSLEDTVSWDCAKLRYKYKRIKKVKSMKKRGKQLKHLTQHTRNIVKLKARK